MSEKHEIACKALGYIEHFFVFVFAVSGCVSFPVYVSLAGFL